MLPFNVIGSVESLKGKKMNSVRNGELKVNVKYCMGMTSKKGEYYITRCSEEKWELVTKSHQHVGNN